MVPPSRHENGVCSYNDAVEVAPIFEFHGR